MQKLKHIKYTKLSPIMLKTIPFPSGVAILSHVGKIRAASAGDFFVVVCLLGSLESPPSI